jgi:predicted TPR repeat methyltransferase
MLKWLKKIVSKKPQPERGETTADSSSATLTKPQTDSAVYKNLGDERLKVGSVDEAVRLYRQAIHIDPRFAEAHSMLGDALRESGKLGEAARCYRVALEYAPDLSEAHYGLGVTLLERSDSRNAAVYFRNAIGFKPDFSQAHNGLGFALLESGNPADALACFQKTISLDPNNGMALHLTASLMGTNPERAPHQYIEKLFDGFANTFDTQLQQLQYETPKNLVAMVAQISAPAIGKWNVLDLGCGTGLVGVEIAAYARQLVGVDLSPKMLEKARARNLYHRLEQADLITVMNNETASTYNLIIAADTLIYLGKLDDVIQEAKRLLCAGGLFAFSVEALKALPDAGPHHPHEYLLQASPSCRYAHSSDYLSRLATDYGFKIHQMKLERIRMSCGKPINGYLVLMENR